MHIDTKRTFSQLKYMQHNPSPNQMLSSLFNNCRLFSQNMKKLTWPWDVYGMQKQLPVTISNVKISKILKNQEMSIK